MNNTENPRPSGAQSPDMVPSTEEGRSPSSDQGGVGQAWSVISVLFAGLIMWGGIGLGLDKLLETKFLTPIGALIGFGGSIYLIIVKYGRPGDLTGSPKADVPPSRTDDTEDKG